MALSSDELTSLLDDLYRAKYSGQTRVRFADGREVQYSSMADINSAISELEQKINGAKPSSFTLATHSRD
jgi:hypothetical protein